MRRTVLIGSVLLPLALVAAGCASEVPRADGPGGPVTPPPTAVSAAPSTPPVTTPPASPSTSPTPSRSHTPSVPSTPTILGHTGFGALKLGMGSKQAQATGLIKPWTGKAAAGCSLYSHLKGAPGDTGNVMFSGDTGVEVIDAYPGISTPEGIHIGSTTAQMLKAYPGWENAESLDQAEGRGGVDVPGNSKAFYRIQTRNGKVTDLTLQLNTANCYE